MNTCPCYDCLIWFLTFEAVFHLQSPDEEVSYTSLRQENDELLKRLAGLQEQKWILEEKVCANAIRITRYFLKYNVLLLY